MKFTVKYLEIVNIKSKVKMNLPACLCTVIGAVFSITCAPFGIASGITAPL
jgi:hypothetical protein